MKVTLPFDTHAAGGGPFDRLAINDVAASIIENDEFIWIKESDCHSECGCGGCFDRWTQYIIGDGAFNALLVLTNMVLCKHSRRCRSM